MKIRNNVFSIFLILLLSLSLLTACQAKVPPTPAAGLAEAADETKAKEHPGEVQKEAEEATPQKQPLEDVLKAAPAEAPAEAEKSAEKSPDGTKESFKPDDKACFQIEGTGVEKSILLSLDEIKTMKDAYFEDDFFSLNSYGTKEYFHFKGVKVKAVLDKAGLNKNAKTVSFIASDGYKQELTLEQALKEDYIDEQDPDKKYPVIIAWHENDSDYDPQKGAPFRLVIGQKEPGDVNKPQWVQNIAKIVVD